MKNNIKEMIKKIPCILKLRNKYISMKEYKRDYLFFSKNYLSNTHSKNKLEYKILLSIHGIEKGLANYNLRCFGKEKIKNLIDLLTLYQKNEFYDKDYCYVLGVNILREYVKTYQKNSWIDKEEYKMSKKFIDENKNIESINFQNTNIKLSEIANNQKINYDSFLSSRHSLRKYSERKLSDEDVEKAAKMALKTPTACNRQMVKIYWVNNHDKKNLILNYGQGFTGFDTTNANIFIITFDVNSNYFIGERNQGWLNSGLVAMNFVNALHSLKIGSCFIQFGNSSTEEQRIKEELSIPKSERIAVILAAGYYPKNFKITYSYRKKVSDIYKKID